ncbi:protein of unknown function [Pseudorhizobium banfieldiae]|uniref:Uncharacterized protein n=1 Tax=Pseudorhizobium banfieldiae TaxID=1125847 RepID=L0NFP0_9HYPH|nr:hypothetical protein [Pseudorhizobium banfieldiae]CAD6606046.1 hypothetical protein RNT25_01771 [arsenite-oxidising bacterium NT-25]CCF19117.1 protein of unknown function [Pseudorhizobium banfieldiae]
MTDDTRQRTFMSLVEAYGQEPSVYWYDQIHKRYLQDCEMAASRVPLIPITGPVEVYANTPHERVVSGNAPNPAVGVRVEPHAEEDDVSSTARGGSSTGYHPARVVTHGASKDGGLVTTNIPHPGSGSTITDAAVEAGAIALAGDEWSSVHDRPRFRDEARAVLEASLPATQSFRSGLSSLSRGWVRQLVAELEQATQHTAPHEGVYLWWAGKGRLHLDHEAIAAIIEAIKPLVTPPPVPHMCASDGCEKPATERFEAGGVGSVYCADCAAKVAAIASAPVPNVDLPYICDACSTGTVSGCQCHPSPLSREGGPPTGIAREAYGVKIPFVVDCLRHYARILRHSLIDAAGHYFPTDIEEAADMIEAGDVALLEAAEKVVTSLAYTPERIAAMEEMRAVVAKLKEE